MAPDHPDIEMVGVITDFSRELDIDDVLEKRATTFFYPGSSIGNFTPEDARRFSPRSAAISPRGPVARLLIGVDGKEEKARLDAAMTTRSRHRRVQPQRAAAPQRKFRLRLRPDGFVHRGFYNDALGRIEMHLESVRDQDVRIDGHVRRFARGERIHTENSYKYAPEDFTALLRSAGFRGGTFLVQPDRGYTVSRH